MVKLEFDLKMVSYQIYSVLLTLEPFRSDLIMPNVNFNSK